MSNIRVQFDESEKMLTGPNAEQQREMMKKRKNLVMSLPPHIILEPILLDQMVTYVWNTLRPKLPEHYLRMYPDQNTVRSRLKDVLFDQQLPQLFYLTIPIISALTNSSPDCLTANAANVPKQSILTLCCQHVSLAKALKWKGRDDFVALLLAAGANPNVTGDKQAMKPITFPAGIFGTVETFKLLASHGVKLNAKDATKGLSCLRDMLTCPRADMVELLLEHLTDEDLAKEIYSINNEKSADSRMSSPVDQLLNLWFSSVKPMTWNVRGVPTAEDVVRCSIALMRRGVGMTPDSFGVACLSKLVSNFDSPDDALEKERHAAIFVAKAFLGIWLPESIRKSILTVEEEPTGCTSKCGICGASKEDAVKPIQLYCGDMFCIGCIKNHAKDNSSCPTCKQPLCREFCPNDKWFDEADIAVGIPGPENLTDEQLEIEHKARYGKETEEGESALEKVQKDRGTNPAFILELSFPPVSGAQAQSGLQWASPQRGPAAIPITLKKVPIIAHLSTRSTYTIVSPAFVHTFGLKKTKLSTSNMIGFAGAKLNETFTALEEFTIQVGGISVKLRNALEMNPAPSFLGIQLGQDFFRSSAYSAVTVGTVIDVNVNGKSGGKKSVMMLTEGGLMPKVGMPGDKRMEELRFYGRCGKSTRIPLLHVGTTVGKALVFPAVGRNGSKVSECHWCRRRFTTMSKCPPCAKVGKVVTYCDENCQKKAWKVHKTNPPHAK